MFISTWVFLSVIYEYLDDKRNYKINIIFTIYYISMSSQSFLIFLYCWCRINLLRDFYVFHTLQLVTNLFVLSEHFIAGLKTTFICTFCKLLLFINFVANLFPAIFPWFQFFPGIVISSSWSFYFSMHKENLKSK